IETRASSQETTVCACCQVAAGEVSRAPRLNNFRYPEGIAPNSPASPPRRNLVITPKPTPTLQALHNVPDVQRLRRNILRARGRCDQGAQRRGLGAAGKSVVGPRSGLFWPQICSQPAI